MHEIELAKLQKVTTNVCQGVSNRAICFITGDDFGEQDTGVLVPHDEGDDEVGMSSNNIGQGVEVVVISAANISRMV